MSLPIMPVKKKIHIRTNAEFTGYAKYEKKKEKKSKNINH